jgi:hypothetical protein
LNNQYVGINIYHYSQVLSTTKAGLFLFCEKDIGETSFGSLRFQFFRQKTHFLRNINSERRGSMRGRRLSPVVPISTFYGLDSSFKSRSTDF